MRVTEHDHVGVREGLLEIVGPGRAELVAVRDHETEPVHADRGDPRQASQRYLHPDRLITVVVGNPAAFERPLSTLGTVTTMRLEDIRR